VGKLGRFGAWELVGCYKTFVKSIAPGLPAGRRRKRLVWPLEGGGAGSESICIQIGWVDGAPVRCANAREHKHLEEESDSINPEECDAPVEVGDGTHEAAVAVALRKDVERVIADKESIH
jgi:hypothetical protein